MTSPDEGAFADDTINTISGGIQSGPVFQGRDFDITIQPRAAAPTALAQLPPQAAGFTGRDEQLARIIGLLDPAAEAGAIAVSAAGLAGVGKTALAVAAGHAARQRGWFAGGVLFIDLHGYDAAPVAPGQALDALLRALGVPAEHIPPDADGRAGMYRSALAGLGEPVLIIADNASAEEQVRPLLPGGGPHRVVVTSRHTLAGLDARLLDITVLDGEASIRLLDTLIRTARPDDCRIAEDTPAASRLAQACGGLPLALQISAALLKADPGLACTDLAAGMESEHQRLEQLRYGDGSGGQAMLSVEAAFELSYQRLSLESARVFRLLPLIPGPDASTAAVAALTDLPPGQARGVLADLARAHLTEEIPAGAGRWQLHDLVRLYARRKCDQDADGAYYDQGMDRLFGYYLNTARAADDHLRALPGTQVPDAFADRASALSWLDAERSCLVAAVTAASEQHRDEIAMLLPLHLAVYFDWRRRFDDQIATCTLSLAAAKKLAIQANEAAALSNLGIALTEVRRFDEAITAHQDAAAIYRETRDRHGEGTALGNLGIALREVRRYDEAITAHQDAAAIYRETRDRHGEGTALNNLGIALREVRRYDEAITAHQDAAAIYRETRDHHGEGTALNNLGIALQQVRRYDEAITAHQDAAAIYRETRDHHSEGAALGNLGNALQQVHRYDEAITAHHADLAICRETGDRHGEGTALNNLGLALRHMRRYDEAITTHQDAAAIYRETRDHHSEGMALGNLGIALREVRRYDEAITASQDAAAIFRETGDHHSEAIELSNLKRHREKQRKPGRKFRRAR